MNENVVSSSHGLEMLHRSVREAFDAVAERFDESFENPITRRLRGRLYELIAELCPVGARVLDINCGTGIDAIMLSRRGYKVTGADLSPGMIARAKEKAVKEDSSTVRFHVAPFSELTRVFREPFDLIFSNFGGLNCVADLPSVADQVTPLLAPGGVFIAVVMPPLSLWETAAALIRIRPGSAFPRLRKNVLATGFSGKTFAVFYHSIKRLKRAFAPNCSLERMFGLSVISPPPHANTFSRRFSRLSVFLEATELRIASWPLVRSLGDHYVAVFRKRLH